jgi:hypothetical protein
MVHALYRPTLPAWDVQWVGTFLRGLAGAEEVLVLGVVVIAAACFWIAGVTLARRPWDYLSVCTRFDLGVAAFLGLFLTRWLVHSQEGVETGGALPLLLLFPYFVFGLYAIGLTRHRGEGERTFLAGHGGAGLVFGVLLGTLFLGTAVAVLFLPYLTAAAEAGYSVLRAATAPFGPVLLRVLRFLLVGRQVSPGHPGAGGLAGSGPGAPAPTASSWWGQLLNQVFAWGLLGVLGAVALVLAGLATWWTVRWLLSRTPAKQVAKTPWSDLLRHLARFWNLLRAWAVRPRQRRTVGAKGLFSSLLIWGARSGVPHRAPETPGEYGLRLRDRFPSVGAEIAMLVDLFNQEVYGERPAEGGRLQQGMRARSRLRSPRLWPSRVRSWLVGSSPRTWSAARSAAPGSSTE